MNCWSGRGCVRAVQYTYMAVGPGLVRLHPFRPHTFLIRTLQSLGEGRYQQAAFEEARAILVSLAVSPCSSPGPRGLWGLWATQSGWSVKRGRPEPRACIQQAGYPDLRSTEKPFGLGQGSLLRTPQELKRIVFFPPWLPLQLLVLGPFAISKPASCLLFCSL